MTQDQPKKEPKQLSISRSKKMIPIIEEARRTFVEARSDSEAVNRLLFHWFHNRQENSIRGNQRRAEEILLRIEQQTTDEHAALRAEVVELKKIVLQLAEAVRGSHASIHD